MVYTKQGNGNLKTPETNSKEINYIINELNLSARVWNNPSPKNDVTVLAIHGWLDNANSFSFLAPLLEAKQVIALDLPGHGFSDHRPTDEDYNITKYVEELIDLIKEGSLEKPLALIGHSLGGGISTLVASHPGNHFEQLILLDALGPYSSDTDPDKQILYEKNTKVSKTTYPSFQAAVTRRTTTLTGKISQEDAISLAERGLQLAKEGYRWRHDSKLLLKTARMTEKEVLDAIKNIKIPVCIIEAKKGILRKFPAFQNRLDAIVDLTHHVIDGGHHFHMSDQCNAAAQLINQFLRRIP
ncbi:MAG: pimeloyl-ACP methyl ester carboxylesterase [Chlamydiales bacterium]